MASTFNNQTADLTNSPANIFTGPTANAADRAIVIGCNISNTHASDDATITLYKDTHEILTNVKVPANTSLELCRGNKYVLGQSENLKAKVTTGSAKTFVSALVITV